MAATFLDTYYPYLAELQSGQYSQTVDHGITLLRGLKTTCPDQYKEMSKGTPFYWLGIAAFLSHDFQTATFLFDAAVSEDVRCQPNKKDTPALLTTQLDEKNVNQAALPIVRAVSKKIGTVIASYSGRKGSQTLTLDHVRRKFLNQVLTENKPHLRTLTTTFISFFFEWDYRAALIELTEIGSREPFFTHLFRGCLLFESLLKQNPTKPPTKPTLGPILKDLSHELAIPNQMNITSQHFHTIVGSLAPKQAVDEAIKCTGKTRNTLGHNLAWEATTLDGENYNLLAENIAVSCLHAIACLYK